MQKRREPFRTIETPDGPVNFYKIEQADELLHSRFMEAEIQEIYIRSGISEDFLSGMIDLLIDRATSTIDVKQLKSDVMAIAQNLQGRVKQLAERSIYEDLACVYFMMDGEPVEMDHEWTNKKKALWRAHPEERDFFTLEAFRLTGKYQDISDADILTAFQAVAERVSQLPILPDL